MLELMFLPNFCLASPLPSSFFYISNSSFDSFYDASTDTPEEDPPELWRMGQKDSRADLEERGAQAKMERSDLGSRGDGAGRK